MKRVSRQHEATYSEVKRLLIELPFYWLNSNLQKQVIITQSITIETTIEPYKMIVSRFCIRPLIPYVLLSAIHPSSGTKTQFFINNSGDLYATAEGVQSVGDWVINGSYIAK